jgi:hypothetical protein
MALCDRRLGFQDIKVRMLPGRVAALWHQGMTDVPGDVKSSAARVIESGCVGEVKQLGGHATKVYSAST